MRVGHIITAIVIAGSTIGVGHSEQVNGNAGAKVITPIMLMAWEEMEFGTIAPDALASGQVTVGPIAGRTCASNLTCLSAYRAAKFSVTGQADALYAISIPSSITLSSGANTMLVDTLIPTHTVGTLTNGYDEFMIGATLHVGANQSTGAYVGGYVVTVEYQ